MIVSTEIWRKIVQTSRLELKIAIYLYEKLTRKLTCDAFSALVVQSCPDLYSLYLVRAQVIDVEIDKVKPLRVSDDWSFFHLSPIDSVIALITFEGLQNTYGPYDGPIWIGERLYLL